MIGEVEVVSAWRRSANEESEGNEESDGDSGGEHVSM